MSNRSDHSQGSTHHAAPSRVRVQSARGPERCLSAAVSLATPDRHLSAPGDIMLRLQRVTGVHSAAGCTPLPPDTPSRAKLQAGPRVLALSPWRASKLTSINRRRSPPSPGATAPRRSPRSGRSHVQLSTALPR
eukprot:4351103-Prymnesium_polylepis.1